MTKTTADTLDVATLQAWRAQAIGREAADRYLASVRSLGLPAEAFSPEIVARVRSLYRCDGGELDRVAYAATHLCACVERGLITGGECAEAFISRHDLDASTAMLLRARFCNKAVFGLASELATATSLDAALAEYRAVFGYRPRAGADLVADA